MSLKAEKRFDSWPQEIDPFPSPEGFSTSEHCCGMIPFHYASSDSNTHTGLSSIAVIRQHLTMAV